MISAPPQSIVAEVERWAPGAWRYFLTRVIAGVRSYPGQVSVTSWWRGPDTNRSVGGSPDSQHLIGTALDLWPVRNDLVAALEANGIRAIKESDHIHAQLWGAGVVRRAGLLDALGFKRA